ncbi:MAG TPA: hypothetical protein VMW52_10925, partial [Phycisphaerae bacterium]|nr:hypothetical protein [Phycisphaerae bacterium]
MRIERLDERLLLDGSGFDADIPIVETAPAAIIVAAAPAGMPGDVDLRDGEGTLDDFVILKANFGRTDAAWTDGDLTGDGIVDLLDFEILKANFGIAPDVFAWGPDVTIDDPDAETVVWYGTAAADRFRTTAAVTATVWAFAGAGDDQVFHNGSGAADLHGGPGADLLVSIGGAADTLTGGPGLDSLWVDAVDVIADVSADEVAAAAVHAVTEFYQPYTTD